MSTFLQITLILCCAYITSLLAIQISYKLFNTSFNKNSPLLFRPVCHKCHKAILFRECLPIINLFANKRQYTTCKHPIPIIETATAFFLGINYIIAFFLFKDNNIQFVCFTLLIFCLTTQALTDARVMYSSDIIHVIELILCIIMSIYCEKNDILQISLKMIGLLLFFILNITIMRLVLKKNALGFGDIKLYLILSTLFSPMETMQFITLSGICGIVFFIITLAKSKLKKNNQNKYSREFAFIPCILMAFLLAFYFIHKY